MIRPSCMPKPASELQPHSIHSIFKWLCIEGFNYTPCVRLLWHIPFLTLLQKEICLHRQIFGKPSCWSGTRCAFLQYKCVQWWCLSFLAWHLKGVNQLEFILEGYKPAAATDGSNSGDAVFLWGCAGALTCCWWLQEMPHTLWDTGKCPDSLKNTLTLKQCVSLHLELQRVCRTFCTGFSERNITLQGGGLQKAEWLAHTHRQSFKGDGDQRKRLQTKPQHRVLGMLII